MQATAENDESGVLKGEVRQTLALVGAVTLVVMAGLVMGFAV